MGDGRPADRVLDLDAALLRGDALTPPKQWDRSC
jgi:hypothetical protein